MDLLHYETEVFTLGIWDNFEDLESKVTLAELLSLYGSMKAREVRQLKMHLKAQGAEVSVFDDEPGDSGPEEKSDPFKAIVERAKEAQEKEKTQDGGSPFLAGIGFNKI